MKRNGEQENLLLQKFVFTAGIILLYLLGRKLPLFGIDLSFYRQTAVDAEKLLLLSIAGDYAKCSVFALGISPQITAGILISALFAMKSREKKEKSSEVRKKRRTVELTLLFALWQAFFSVRSLHFLPEMSIRYPVRLLAFLEMVSGSLLLLWMSDRNKRFGIGGQSVMILINILDGIMRTLQGADRNDYAMPLIISALAVVVVIFADRTEKRIGLQRIGIRSEYADKNYLAVKLNPTGVTPVMFASAIFALPQLLLFALGYFFPETESISAISAQLTLSKPIGVAVYLFCIYLLAFISSMMYLNPKDYTDRMLKSGDSLENLHPGRETKKYLTRVVYTYSFIGATLLAGCVAVPLVLQFYGRVNTTLMMLPVSFMLFTGIWQNVSEEIRAVQKMASYRSLQNLMK